VENFGGATVGPGKIFLGGAVTPLAPPSSAPGSKQQ